MIFCFSSQRMCVFAPAHYDGNIFYTQFFCTVLIFVFSFLQKLSPL